MAPPPVPPFRSASVALSDISNEEKQDRLASALAERQAKESRRSAGAGSTPSGSTRVGPPVVPAGTSAALSAGHVGKPMVAPKKTHTSRKGRGRADNAAATLQHAPPDALRMALGGNHQHGLPPAELLVMLEAARLHLDVNNTWIERVRAPIWAMNRLMQNVRNLPNNPDQNDKDRFALSVVALNASVDVLTQATSRYDQYMQDVEPIWQEIVHQKDAASRKQ
ncbi:hypothetical protein IAU60_005354 [Kwoniella sp. DSM 27419]